jgi:hypothetical protein
MSMVWYLRIANDYLISERVDRFNVAADGFDVVGLSVFLVGDLSFTLGLGLDCNAVGEERETRRRGDALGNLLASSSCRADTF